ncbi:hypothetical protein MTP10_12125 [Nonomuraea sp. 3-1Str]|nr:hypothetical protein [Nonomuraea sp. 3-1Str]
MSELTGYSWQHLGAIERGSVAPSESVISSCDAALGAGGVLNGLLPGVIREQAHLRHNSDAARRTGSVEPASAVEWERLSAVSTFPSAVSKGVVQDIEAITAHQRHLYHQLTSAQMLAPVDGHLGLLLSLLDTPGTDSLRRRLASAAGEAAGFAAWIWFDLGDPFKMAYRSTAIPKGGAHLPDSVVERGADACLFGGNGAHQRGERRASPGRREQCESAGAHGQPEARRVVG